MRYIRSGNRRLRTITVEHPAYGRYDAEGVEDKLEAVMAAARAWKVQWSEIARAASFTEEKEGDRERADSVSI